MGLVRREFLLATAAAASLAGCTQNDSQDTDTTTDEEGEPTEQRISIEAPNEIKDSGDYEIVADLKSDETPLVITANDVTIDGQGHTIQADNPNLEQHGIHITGDNVTITNVTVSGWNEQGAGILCEFVSGAKLSEITTRDNMHGVHLAGSTDAEVKNSTSSGNDKVGIYLDESDDSTLTGNTVTENVDSGIFLRGASGNTVTENTISDNDLINNLGGIHMEESTDNEVKNNEIRANGDTAIIAIDSVGNDISDNLLENNGRHGVFLEGSSENTLTGNTATGNEISGIDLAWESDNNIIDTNTLTGNDGHGIYLLSSHGNEITDNEANENSQVGIILADASENTIRANTIANNTIGGIDLIGESQYTSLVGSHDNTVTGNEVLDNEGTDGAGIRLLHSDRNTLRENTISGTGTYGIEVFDASATEITANTITDNDGDGIFFEVDVTDASVTENTIKNNEIGIGVGVELTDEVTIKGNDIVGNEKYGVATKDPGTGQIPGPDPDGPDLDATNNWWGDSSGPAHPENNPDGSGDVVSDNVAFDPWESASQSKSNSSA